MCIHKPGPAGGHWGGLQGGTEGKAKGETLVSVRKLPCEVLIKNFWESFRAVSQGLRNTWIPLWH